MRWTELTLIPTALAMAAPVQWVACAGGPAKVKATTRSAISGLNGGMRDGRVLSRPPDMLLRAVPVGDNCLQRGSVGGAQFDLGSFVHSPDSHDRVCRGIRKRIE